MSLIVLIEKSCCSWDVDFAAGQRSQEFRPLTGSAAGWGRVAQSMATDAGAFATYWAHYHGRGNDLKCDSDACKRLQLCRVRVSDLTEFLACIR